MDTADVFESGGKTFPREMIPMLPPRLYSTPWTSGVAIRAPV